MLIYESNDPNIRTNTEAYYEAVASQEEIYLEEAEEEVRVTLEYDGPPRLPSESPDQYREQAVEELITGDSDDPPLSEGAVERMLLP